MSKIKTALNNLVTNIKEGIEDLSSLEVTTYSGNFNLDFNDIAIKSKPEDPNSPFKIKSLLQNNESTLNANLNLVAYSRFEIDSDAANIVKSDLSENDKTLIEAHKSMVESAMEARKATFEMVSKMLNLGLD